MEARGQAVLLPAGRHRSLRLVGSAHNGPVQTAVTVWYADGGSAALPVTFGDWAGATPAGATPILAMPHRIKAGQGVDGPPVALFGHALALDAARTVRALSLPDDPRVEVYAVTLG